jgi:hypothetical protein
MFVLVRAVTEENYELRRMKEEGGGCEGRIKKFGSGKRRTPKGLKLARCPHSLITSLATLPSMSLTPLLRSRAGSPTPNDQDRRSETTATNFLLNSSFESMAVASHPLQPDFFLPRSSRRRERDSLLQLSKKLQLLFKRVILLF